MKGCCEVDEEQADGPDSESDLVEALMVDGRVQHHREGRRVKRSKIREMGKRARRYVGVKLGDTRQTDSHRKGHVK